MNLDVHVVMHGYSLSVCRDKGGAPCTQLKWENGLSLFLNPWGSRVPLVYWVCDAWYL